MTQVTVQEAQERLPELLAAAQEGEAVEIRSDSGRAFRLTPVRARPPVTGIPKAGSCREVFVVPPDFKEPLEEMREYME